MDRISANSAEHNYGFIGGFYIRPFGPVPAGFVAEGHAHYIDHMMWVEAGAVLVEWSTPDGRSGAIEIEACNFITVKAEAKHKVTALVDGTKWRCMFAEAEADKLDSQTPVPYMMAKADV